MIDVAVIGAGPVGLACALEAQRAGLSACVIEKGTLVNSLVGYPTNMEFFSTPDLLEIGEHPFPTQRYKPIREDALDYYRRVSETENLDLRLYTRVERLDGEQNAFRVVTDRGTVEARRVVVATGFFDVPNTLGIPGEAQPHVSYYFKEPYAHIGQHVVVVGAKNSAAKAALSLYRNGVQVTLVVRGHEISPSVKYWIRPDLLNRIAEGRITALFDSTLTAIHPDAVEIQTPEGARTLPTDFVYALIGYRPDYPLLRALGIAHHDDAARTPVYDEATQEANRAGVYLAGTVCGGLRTSRWFIENGRHHAKVIAAHMAEMLRGERVAA